jgi:hypothetical protein
MKPPDIEMKRPRRYQVRGSQRPMSGQGAAGSHSLSSLRPLRQCVVFLSERAQGGAG